MSDVRLPQHGRDHRVGGSDPIPGMGEGGGGGIQFDTYPQAGGWLYVETTNDATSPSGYGIELNSQDDDGIWIHADNWDVQIDASHNVNLTAGNNVSLSATHSVGISGSTGVTIAGAPFSVQADSTNTIEIIPGTHFNFDSDFGSIHMVAGGVDIEGPGVAARANAGDLILNAAGSATSYVQLSALATGEGPIHHEIYGYQASELGSKPGHRFGGNTASGVGTRFEFMDLDSSTAYMRIDVSAGGTPTYHIKTGATWVADL